MKYSPTRNIFAQRQNLYWIIFVYKQNCHTDKREANNVHAQGQIKMQKQAYGKCEDKHTCRDRRKQSCTDKHKQSLRD